MTPEERLRLTRIAEAWRADAASDLEVRAARVRYRERRKTHDTSLHWMKNFSLGFGVAALILFASRFVFETESPLVARGPSSSATMEGVSAVVGSELDVPRAAASSDGTRGAGSRFVATIERDGRRTPVTPSELYEVEAGERVIVHLGQESHEVTGPVLIVFQLDPDRASGFRMVQQALPEAAPSSTPARGQLPARARPQREEAEVSEDGAQPEPNRGAEPPTARFEAQPSAAPEGSWTQVAEALRSGNQPAAERGLRSLSNSSDVRTRHSAQLTLAQLLLSQGRVGEARALLTSLAESGDSAFVRRRARELLRED